MQKSVIAHPYLMRLCAYLLAATLVLSFARNVRASDFFVDLNSPNPQPPYATWATAIRYLIKQGIAPDAGMSYPMLLKKILSVISELRRFSRC